MDEEALEYLRVTLTHGSEHEPTNAKGEAVSALCQMTVIYMR